jgi:hypothetical protein
MPTIFRSGPYRFFFFSNEGSEPPHIHVESSGCYAKFWLNPVRFDDSQGYRAHDLEQIRRIIYAEERIFLNKWHEYFGSS